MTSLARWSTVLSMFVFTFTPLSFSVNGPWSDALGDASGLREELMREINEMKQIIQRQAERISELEKRLMGEPAQEATAEEYALSKKEVERHVDAHLLHRVPGHELTGGLRIGIGATGVLQSAQNANGDELENPGSDVTDASYSADLEFEKKLGPNGLAFLHLETGDGAGVEDRLKVFSNVNRDAADADNTVELTELWYEHQYAGVPVTLTIGQIDATVYVDTNEYANDETTQFLGHIFRNSPTVPFPDNALGVNLGMAPAELVDAQLLIMDANPDSEDVFDDLFLSAQVNVKPNLLDRAGNYRVLGWVDKRAHRKWLDASADDEDTYGWGLSFDQELADHVAIFGRYAWANPDQRLLDLDEDFSLEHAWSGGVQLSGDLWGRADDVFAAAVGQVSPSDEYANANEGLRAKKEGHFEAYYSLRLSDHLTISPDLQFIWNPYGGDAENGDSTITVVGVRGQLDF